MALVKVLFYWRFFRR